MYKRFLIINRRALSFLFLLLPMLALAQESIGMPPSPTVASLVSITKDSVNNSGKVVHNIPIFNMKLRNKSFPIGLTYSSSGVRVEEIPSYVGTGWNLSAGGVITRSVMDHPDDLKNADHGSGILHTNIMSQIENFSEQIENGGYNEVASGHFFRYNINGDNMETRNDTQPDLFYFSFFGRSGKFVFNKNKQIVSLSNDNLKFSHTLDADGSLKTFTITDTNGTRYLFSEREYSKTHYNSGSQWEFLSSRAKRQRHLNFYSSWHLKSVTISTNPNHWTTVSQDPLEMVFNYEDETIRYQIKNSEMGKICFDRQCEDTNISNTTYYDTQNSTAASTTDYIINSKKISSIASDYFNISFVNTTRADLNGGLKLSTVKIKDANDNLVKKIDFQHDYFLSPDMPTSNNFEYKRLKLDAIRVNDQFFQEFEYYSDHALPHRKSTEQDFWGYFNDNNAISLVSKVYTTFNDNSPEYHIFPPINEAVVYEYGSVDRNVNPSTIHMGMLKKIEYQTAGHKTFFYEPNDFTLDAYTAAGSSIKGNGVRVDRIEYFDGDDTEHLNYNYNSPVTGVSSGRVSHLPKFATHIPWNFVYSTVSGIRVTNPTYSNSVHFIPNQPIWETDANGNQYVSGYETCIIYGDPTTYNYSPTNNPNAYFAMTTRRFSSSQIPLSSNVSEPLIYENISIKEGDNGEKRYSFDALGALDFLVPPSYDTEKFIQKRSYKTSYWHTDLDGYLIGPPPQVCPYPPVPIGGIMLNQFNAYYQFTNITGESHPFAPKPNWNRSFGNLKSYTYVNEQGHKVFKNDYAYETYGGVENPNVDKKVVSLKYRLFDRPIGYGGWSYNNSTGYSPHTGPTAWIWSFYDVYHGIGLSPTSITRTNYYDDETISISKTTNNTYAHGNLLASTSFEDSKGNTHKTKYRYSLDFQAGTTNFWEDEFGNWHENEVPNIYRLMTQRNLIVPIEIVEEVNENVVSAQVHEYTSSYAGVLFERTYKLETSNYAYDYTPASAQSNSSSRILIKDSNMVERYSNDRFDGNGNVLQETTKDDEPIITLWGYNRSLPIARIVGAKYTDVNAWFLNEYNETLGYLNEVSNYDVNSSNGEYNFRSWLNKLRTVIKDNSNGNIQLTTFTYNPLVGITSIVDVNGKISYYEYDEFNRLIKVSDRERNILSETQYNYKLQN